MGNLLACRGRTGTGRVRQRRVATAGAQGRAPAAVARDFECAAPTTRTAGAQGRAPAAVARGARPRRVAPLPRFLCARRPRGVHSGSRRSPPMVSEGAGRGGEGAAVLGMHAHGCQTRASSSMAGCRTAGVVGGERIRPAAPAASEAARRTSTNVRYVPRCQRPPLPDRTRQAWRRRARAHSPRPHTRRRQSRPVRTARHSTPPQGRRSRRRRSDRRAGVGAHPDAGGAAADRIDWAAPPPHAESRLRHGAPRAHCDALRQAARPGRPAPRRRPDACTVFNAGRIAGCKCRGSTSGWPQGAPSPPPQVCSEDLPCGAGRSARPRT